MIFSRLFSRAKPEEHEQPVAVTVAAPPSAAPLPPATLSVAEACHALAQTRTDDQWRAMLVQSLTEPILDQVPMPGFPNETLQRGMVGNAGEIAINEAFLFWQEVKKYWALSGSKPLGEASVLDFGTGWGRYLRFFLKDTPPAQLLGLDVDPSFVAVAEELLPGVPFRVVQPLPPTDLADGSFDLVCAYSVFSHLAESAHQAWISEFARILRPGGMVIVTTQRRDFLDYCDYLRQQETLETVWHENLARSFVDTDAARKAYDEGEFLYSPTGGGAVRDASFYGEAIVSPAYVRRAWTDRFEIIDFVDDPQRCPQAIIVARKA